MKKQYQFFSLLSFVLLMLVFSCTKEGPIGPPGADGMDGIDGVDGVDGIDGNSTCMVCHEAGTSLYAKQVQYEASIHKIGGNFERNGSRCAGCHTHEGFLERMAGDPTNPEISAAVSNPTPVNCRTCHNIHDNYDLTDYDLRYSQPVTLINGGTVDFGKGNLCINCHQSRPYEIPDMAMDSFDVTSSRYGTHHGPQSALVFGLGGYEIPGSVAYSNSPHKDLLTEGCVECHMAEAFGNSAGGHTFNMTYIYHGGETPNMVACTGCHAGAEDFNINGAQDDIEMLLEELRSILVAKGVINTNSGLWNTGTYPSDLAGAMLNYKYIEEDRSHGVHNYNYARALLKNAIESLE